MSLENLELAKEYPLADEMIDIDTIAEIEVGLQSKAAKKQASQDDSKQSTRLRGQHPKQHGCVWAEFIVEENLAEDLRIGIFKEPGKKFPAWIRFSNARKQDDAKGGAHGMAIKLIDVAGDKVLEGEKDARTQDFVLFDHPVFFIRNVKNYVLFDRELVKALLKSPTSPLPVGFIFPGLNPLQWHVPEFLILLKLQQKRIGSPLETTYWSATPYLFGSKAVKYVASPSSPPPVATPIATTENALREAMYKRLTEAEEEVRFDFYIQVQTDAERMPIEDATVEWKVTEEHKVATVRIPPQRFNSPQQQTFGENLSYTPWHSLPEHKPLGGINRTRKEVYIRTSKRRHEENGVLPQEPTLQSFSPDLIG